MNIIITGASRGIGKAMARKLIADGHRVILISRNARKLEELADACNKEAGKQLAHSLPFDLADLAQLEEEFTGRLIAMADRVDALVNNAGQLVNKPFTGTRDQEARQVFETNFFAPALLTRICLPLMKKSSLRHVVNISSMAGFQGSKKFPGLSYYSASKAAIASLSEFLAEELKEEGIHVNSLALGSVQTEMLAEAFPDLKAPLNPPEMAEFMVWFILEGAKYFNGKILPVSLSNP